MRIVLAGALLLLAAVVINDAIEQVAVSADLAAKTSELSQLGLRVSDVDSATAVTRSPVCYAREKEVQTKLALATNIRRCHWIQSVKPCYPIRLPYTSCGFSRYYRIYVPANSCNLFIKISGGIGNADLYVRRNALPWGPSGSFHYSDTGPGNNEMIHVGCNYVNSWYFIQVRAASWFYGVKLEACYCPNCCGRRFPVDLAVASELVGKAVVAQPG